jgi:hypothetical protein
MLLLDIPALQEINRPLIDYSATLSNDSAKQMLSERRKLVKLELDFISQIRANWELILADLNTDRAQAESIISNCYAYVGLARPRILWAENPITAISILINRPDLEDVASIILNQVWDSSNTEIERQIDPDFIQLVMAHANPRARIVGEPPTISFDPLGDYLNQVAIAKLRQVYPLLDLESLPTALQDHRTAYLSYFDYFQAIGINIPQINLLIDLAKSCGCCWTFKNIAILTPKPTAIIFHRGSTTESGNYGGLRALIYDGENILA